MYVKHGERPITNANYVNDKHENLYSYLHKLTDNKKIKKFKKHIDKRHITIYNKVS